MKRVLVFALILTLSGTLGFGASFFATTKSLRNHAFLGTLAPQTMHPLVFLTMLINSLVEKVTLATVSIVSAVPEAEVIAREHVFGI